MNSLNNILLASHGTEGAMAAEKMALILCNKGAKLHHLIVVPTLWEGITGDDWLNNGSTRDTFRRYLETELGITADELSNLEHPITQEIEEAVEFAEKSPEPEALDYQKYIYS